MNEAFNQTRLAIEETGGLGELVIMHPAGVFPITPASRISLEAIGNYQQNLSGIGIDWGPGSGVLTIATAKIANVRELHGLEIVPANVKAARENARLNEVEEKTRFYHSNGFMPVDETDTATVSSLKGQVDFILANPPSSEGDDGFDFRRQILRDARQFLVDGGVVLLSISFQYGRRRISNLTRDVPEFTHRGALASTDWVPFVTRPDLLECMKAYAAEEDRGGHEYEFALPDQSNKELVNARTATDFYEQTERSPLSKWQTHLFEFKPSD